MHLFKISLLLETNEELVDDPDPISSPQGTPNPASAQAARATKKKVTLTFPEYKRLTNSIVTYIRHEEEKRVAEIEECEENVIY